MRYGKVGASSGASPSHHDVALRHAAFDQELATEALSACRSLDADAPFGSQRGFQVNCPYRDKVIIEFTTTLGNLLNPASGVLSLWTFHGTKGGNRKY